MSKRKSKVLIDICAIQVNKCYYYYYYYYYYYCEWFEPRSHFKSRLSFIVPSIIPSTNVIQLTLTLKMTTTHVVETSVTVNNNSPIQDYVHPDDQTQPTLLLWLLLLLLLLLFRNFTRLDDTSWYSVVLFSLLKQEKDEKSDVRFRLP